jgi:hypothetical protein
VGCSSVSTKEPASSIAPDDCQTPWNAGGGPNCVTVRLIETGAAVAALAFDSRAPASPAVTANRSLGRARASGSDGGSSA